MWRLFKSLGLFFSCLAHADVGLLLGESTGQGMSRWTSAGHSAVYLSRICPDGPVRMRLCSPGEHGSVLNNYIDFSEDKPYEWNIVPLSVYLYGVEDLNNRPIHASPELRAALQERYRQERLQEICPPGPCTEGNANWRYRGSKFRTRCLHVRGHHQRLEDARSVLNWKILARELKTSSPSADRAEESIMPSGGALLP
jgi:hypothetical protein